MTDRPSVTNTTETLIRTTMHQETLGWAGILTFRFGLVAPRPSG
jgi:hypothetical protein